MLCTRCGTWLPDINVYRDDDPEAQYCDPCNDAFYKAMAIEFPFGQCYSCGAAGREVVCELGKSHVIFNHEEGRCSQWTDYEIVPQEGIDAGFCSYGCHPKLEETEKFAFYFEDLEMPF